MNIERLTILAEWLEAGAPPRDGVEGFDIQNVGGTHRCIAGAARAFWPVDAEDPDKALGINSKQAHALYMPPGWRHEQPTVARYPQTGPRDKGSNGQSPGAVAVRLFPDNVRGCFGL